MIRRGVLHAKLRRSHCRPGLRAGRQHAGSPAIGAKRDVVSGVVSLVLKGLDQGGVVLAQDGQLLNTLKKLFTLHR